MKRLKTGESGTFKSQKGGDADGKFMMNGVDGDQKVNPESKSKKKKSKKVVDANGDPPKKRPLSAYMLYNNHRRPIL